MSSRLSLGRALGAACRPASVRVARSGCCFCRSASDGHTFLFAARAERQVLRPRLLSTSSLRKGRDNDARGGSKITTAVAAAIKDRVAPALKHEDIYNLPNFLTLSRLLATPVIGYLILHDAHAWALGLFFYAGVTDLVDGWIARRWRLQTVVGSVIDPLADKALMTIVTVCLAVQGALPVWLATIILGRDVSLAVAAIYYRYASLPPPKSFARYWDFSLPSAAVHPTGMSKANTFLQLVLIGATTAMPVAAPTVAAALQGAGAGFGVGQAMAAAQGVVAATTVWSGASYLWTRDAVQILGNGSPEHKRRILVRGRVILGACFVGCLGTALALEDMYSRKAKAAAPDAV